MARRSNLLHEIAALSSLVRNDKFLSFIFYVSKLIIED